MNSRRHFLKTMLTAAGMYSFKNMFFVQDVFASIRHSRLLKLYNIHTGERLQLRYSSAGICEHDDMDKINYFLRCHYTDEIKPIPSSLMNLLCGIKDRLVPTREVHIISGYRSPEYNEYLRSSGHQVVKESLHLRGLAVDFTIPGVRTRAISRVAKRFAAGGVGKYPDFVHIDLGRVRYW